VVGVLSGTLLLGEKVTLNELAGGAVIMAGLAVVVFAKGPAPAPAEFV
jgi:drug/metabolite transporter (DMT)-like permease